jgi:transglutaminase-like putative cysteine protease
MPAMSTCIVVLITFIWCAVSASAAVLLPSEQKEPIIRNIFYSYTLENTTARPVTNVEFLTYAPVKRTTFQQCTGLRSSHPNAVQTDELGNQVLRFVFDLIPPFAKKVVSVHAEILQTQGRGWRMAIEPSMYLHPARYIETGHEKIARTARSLIAADSTKTAGNIYRFVSEHVCSNGYSSREYGAVYALEHGRGDCTESMYLFVALCRAAGLPARGIGGYMLAESTILRPSKYHNWAEFYDGQMWRTADPQQKLFALSPTGYVATKVLHDLSDQRVFSFHRFHVGNDGVKVRMND